MAVGIAMDPSVGSDLVLELTRAPACIAKSEQPVLWPRSVANSTEHITCRSKRNRVGHGKCRISARVVTRVQDETLLGIDGTSKEYRALRASWRHFDLELLHQLTEPQPREGFVDDEAHSAAFLMYAHEHDAALEARIWHARHCNQELTFEEAFGALAGSLSSRSHSQRLARWLGLDMKAL